MPVTSQSQACPKHVPSQSRPSLSQECSERVSVTSPSRARTKSVTSLSPPFQVCLTTSVTRRFPGTCLAQVRPKRVSSLSLSLSLSQSQVCLKCVSRLFPDSGASQVRPVTCHKYVTSQPPVCSKPAPSVPPACPKAISRFMQVPTSMSQVCPTPVPCPESAPRLSHACLKCVPSLPHKSGPSQVCPECVPSVSQVCSWFQSQVSPKLVTSLSQACPESGTSLSRVCHNCVTRAFHHRGAFDRVTP